MNKIMFNDTYSLTQAVLNEIKNVTRRVIEFDLMNIKTKESIEVTQVFYEDAGWCIKTDANNRPYPMPKCFLPKYRVGEVVAIAQSYSTIEQTLDRHSIPLNIIEHPGWRNKMFVTADLMPHQLRIMNVTAERLQDITEEDCLLEGIEVVDKGMCDVAGALCWYGIKGTDIKEFTPRDAFAKLIDKIAGKGTWESNPFVWRYEFELLK